MAAVRVRRGNPGNCSRILRAAAGFATVLAASCGGGGESTSDGFFRLQLEADQGVVLTGADRLVLQVTGPGASYAADFAYPSGEIELSDVPLGLDRVFHVEMRSGGAAGTIVAVGDSDPEDLVEGTFTTVIVILKEPT